MGLTTSRALATGRPWSGGRIWAAGSPASMKRHPRSGSGPARCHAGRHAAIDDDLAASDVARGVAGEEQQRGGNLPRLGRHIQRYGAGKLMRLGRRVAPVGVQRLDLIPEPGRSDAGMNLVDANAIRRRGFRQQTHRPLGGAVAAEYWSADQPPDRQHQHAMPDPHISSVCRPLRAGIW